MYVFPSSFARIVFCILSAFFPFISIATCAAMFMAENTLPQPPHPSAPIAEHEAQTEHGQADLFPGKARIRYAKGFTIEYHNTYKKIQVLSPWRDAQVTFTYLLVPHGQTPPTAPPEAVVVEVPVRRAALTSTSSVPFFPMLQIEQALVGFSGCTRVTTPKVVEMIQQGQVTEIGCGSNGMDRELNMEQLFALQPDIVITHGTGIPQFDKHPKLIEAGFRTVIEASHMESTPLGRTEWIKFVAAFFNKEAEAGRLFDEIALRYEELAEKMRAVTERPTVLYGMVYRDLWYVAGGRSYHAKFMADAGADYLWSDDTSTGVMPIGMETVFDRARDAAFWLNPGACSSLEELSGADDRYGAFRAFRTGQVYNNNAKIGPGGGNDFWETGMARPDLVLADLISIFHPDRLPSHQRIWYRQLPLHAGKEN